MKNCCNQGLSVVNEPFFCPRMQAYVVRGPRGATGAQGPQGPQGISGTINNHATFATEAEVGVLINGALPVASTVTHHGTKISLANNASGVILRAGTYFVTYDLSVIFSGDQTNATFAMAVNGEALPNLARVVAGSECILPVHGSAIIEVDDNSTLSIQNAAEAPVEISNFCLSVFNLM